MYAQPRDLGDSSDSFRLHYVQGTGRCVISYDSLDAALLGAFRKLEKNQQMKVWISDAAKRVLLDGSDIRARLARRDPDERLET